MSSAKIKTYGRCLFHDIEIDGYRYFNKCLPKKCHHRKWKNQEPENTKNKHGIKILGKTRGWS